MPIPPPPFFASTGDVHTASDLLVRFGAVAAARAATRADGARRIGNHLAFCRWRQVERLIRWLEADVVPGTVH